MKNCLAGRHDSSESNWDHVSGEQRKAKWLFNKVSQCLSNCEFSKLSVTENIHFPNGDSVWDSQCILAVKGSEKNSSKRKLISFNPDLIKFTDLGIHFSWDIYSHFPSQCGKCWIQKAMFTFLVSGIY